MPALPMRIYLEFDGAYWHSKPATVALDAKKDQVFRDGGYRLIRVRDTDFKKNPKRMILRVLKQLRSSQETLFPI